MTEETASDVIIVGGGIIGLACAWRAAQAGLSVQLVDERPGQGASYVAAGMLAPVTEATFGEHELATMSVASARRWPGFAAELEAASDSNIDYRDHGTLLVGATADDATVLRELAEYHQRLALNSSWMTSRACRKVEPLVGPRIAGGLHAADDHQVDPRRAVAALHTAAKNAGVTFAPAHVAWIEQQHGAVTGVRLAAGQLLEAPQVVLAAGVGSALAIAGLSNVEVPVRPVKGELLVLGPRPGVDVPQMTVRALVRGRPVYVAPRRDGRVIVGATQHEQHDTTVTAGGVRQLLDAAATVVPAIDELAVIETLAGVRPATPDNLPLIGPSHLDGLTIATGHYRNGVLLAPITADAVAKTLTGDRLLPELGPADPRRFSVNTQVGAL